MYRSLTINNIIDIIPVRMATSGGVNAVSPGGEYSPGLCTWRVHYDVWSPAERYSETRAASLLRQTRADHRTLQHLRRLHHHTRGVPGQILSTNKLITRDTLETLTDKLPGRSGRQTWCASNKFYKNNTCTVPG